jgi:hypothetical protein
VPKLPLDQIGNVDAASSKRGVPYCLQVTAALTCRSVRVTNLDFLPIELMRYHHCGRGSEVGRKSNRMIRVDIKPGLLSWARERAGLEPDALAHRFPKLAAWEQGSLKPTLNQVEDFAKATHTPIGFLFLQEPPVEKVPIPDFRTIRNQAIARPSPTNKDGSANHD